MSILPEDFVEIVIKDLESNNSKRKVVKAGLIERYSHKSCAPLDIHPNPDDEFSHPDVGPNFEIITNYTEYIKKAAAFELPIYEEPLIVEKIEPCGYRLLNGHHRWFAAIRMHVNKVRIQIVNLVHEEDLNRMLKKTENTKRVAFDLDEVLLASDASEQEIISDKLLEKRIKERLRKGAPEVIKEFQNKGYDVWIYTAGYNSEEYINHFFSMYELEIEGILNGINEKRKTNKQSAEKFKKLMEHKYNQSIHIDNDTVLFVDASNKSYEQYDISNYGNNWNNGIINILSNPASPLA